MQSDTTYFVVMVAMALAVIVTCGAGITWNYFSARRWGERRSRQRVGASGAGDVVQHGPAERRHHDLAA
jgi:hypothetical protein